jgi:hypothetical protein
MEAVQYSGMSEHSSTTSCRNLSYKNACKAIPAEISNKN